MKMKSLVRILVLFAFALPCLGQGLSPVPRLQFLDNIGKPVSGGRVCTYAAGSSTPLATYSDPELRSPNTNPLVLDSAGRPTYNGVGIGIYLSASRYKFVLQASGVGAQASCPTSGTVIWTQDDVSSPASSYDLASIGSTLIGFTQTGTGAVTRTVDSRLKETVSVKDFGANGDGTTDDTAAFNLARNASKNIFLPAGTYALSEFPITTGVSLVPESPGSVILKQYNAAKAILIYNATAVSVYDTMLKGIYLQGHVSSTHELIHMEAHTPYVVQNAEIDVVTGGGYHSLKMVTTAANEIYGSRISVLQRSSISTGVILSGVYNTYWMHVAASANGIAVSDTGQSSTFLQLVADGQLDISGGYPVVINPTVEAWTGTAQTHAMRFRGRNPTIVGASLVNVPPAKAPIGIGFIADATEFSLLGLNIIGSVWPDYPIELHAGNTGTISHAVIAGGYKLEAYVADSILQNITFGGDCSSLTNRGKKYFGSAVYDPSSLAPGGKTTISITVTGAVLGDHVDEVSFSLDLQGMILYANVAAPDNVNVSIFNSTTSAIDLASGTIKVRVSKL
jgi:hypothetical protein